MRRVRRSIVRIAAIVALSPVALAAAPVHKPYVAPVQNEATAAYEFRTRIDTARPECRRFADEADAVFLDERLQKDVKAQAGELARIAAAARAARCLAP